MKDMRSYLYTKDDYVSFKTHDPYFNAAMKEMVYTGYMHNYMRMYWAKKIIEWSNTHKEAFETITYLNNKYFIDGRNANSFTWDCMVLLVNMIDHGKNVRFLVNCVI